MELNCNAKDNQRQTSLNREIYKNRIEKLLQILELSTSENVIIDMSNYINSLGLSLALNQSIDIDKVIENVNPQRISNNPIILNKADKENLRLYLQNLRTFEK